MSDKTITQVREARAEAEKQISGILTRLARETGLPVRAVSVAKDPAATRQLARGDLIGAAVAEGMKFHVKAKIHLEAL